MKTMTREKFYEYAMEHAGEYLPADVGDYEFKLTDCKRANEGYKGMFLKKSGESETNVVRPVANLDLFFEQLDEGRSIDEVMQNIAEMVTTPVPSTMKTMADTSWLTDYSNCKEKLMVGVYDKDTITTSVMREVADGLALVVRVVIDESESGMACYTVVDGLLDSWGIDEDTLFADAIENSKLIRPAVITSLSDKTGIPFPDGRNEPYIVSCETGHLGAAALFYDGVMKEVAEKIGGSYYAVPSSIHEFLCFPVGDIGSKSVSEMVYSVNRECVDPRDRLSDNAYRYDVETETFSKVV